MAFNVKEDWPILAFGLLALLGLVLIMTSGSSGASALTTGGLSGSQESSLLSQENASAAQIEEAQLAASTEAQSVSEQTIGGIITDVVNNDAANSQASLSAQVQEYLAYEQELGTAFGDSTQLSGTLGTANDQLQASLAQTSAQQSTLSLAYIMGLLQSLFSNATSAYSSTLANPAAAAALGL